MSAAPALVAVIPYFQREPGLLRAAVGSVLAQRDAPPCHAIVVDDGAPWSAMRELDGLPPEDAARVQVVVQPNAGPGAARNRGLDLVPAGTRVVAFLDSDDRWTPHYAADALAAFDAGADLFFANSERFGADGTRFDWGHASGRRLDAAAHPPIDATRGVHRFDGDFFDFAVHRSGIVSTSTLAYRHDRFPALRFDPRLFNGQDRFFKLQLAKAARHAAFSTRVGAHEGQGVNIFDSSRWGSEKSLNLLANYIRLARTILAEIELDAAQRAFVRGQLAQSRRDLAGTVLHLARRGTPIQRGALTRAFAADPASAALFVPYLLRAGWRKLAARA